MHQQPMYKPSHERSISSSDEGIWYSAGDPFDRPPERHFIRNGLIVVGVVLLLVGLGLLYAR